MIPILYSSTEKDYTHNGIAPLKESIEATVTEEANGLLELYLEYPVNGMWAREIKDQMLIKAKPNDLDEPHVFRIYEIVKNMEDQLLYIYASSITNDLGLDLVKSATVTNATGQEAMNVIKANLTQGTTLTLGSDIATRSSTKWSMRNPLNCIVGEEGSIVQWWGGELKRNNEGLYLYARRGRNDIAVLRQGKNLEGFDMTVSTQGLITRILPHATIRNTETGEESELIGSVVDSPRVGNYPVRRIVAVDYTDESITTLAQLNSAAASYFSDRNPDSDKPTVRFSIDMLQLSNTSYYAKFKKLESVGVFDTVTVYVPKFDVNVNVKIRSVEYDVLREKTVRIVAGDAVSDIFKDIRNDYTNIINDTTATLQTIIQQAANGNNKIWRTTSTPVGPHKKGDLWYKPVGEHMVLLQWDGLTWEEILNTEDLESVRREVEAALAKAEEAKQAAEQSYADSVAEAERFVQVQTDAFNAQMSDVNEEISTVKSNIDTAISNVNREIADSFTSLSDSISEVDDLATQAKADAAQAQADADQAQADADQALLDLKSKASTAALQAYAAATEAELALKASKEALEDGLALKVAVATYNAKVTELNSLISTAQSKADTAAADLLKKADTTVVNAELAKKLATSTYNAKMKALDTAISGHTTRIEATETGLLAKASTADVNALKTRMSTAETSLTTNAKAIALKASQEDLDTVEGRLETTEAELVVQAGEIASKVAKTEFNKLSGRVGTAESTIIQHASEIASRVKQTDFDSLSGRVETAESSITQQASQIASKVATTTYNSGIASKENVITKSNTAPDHSSGKLWLDTSVTPNILKRSTGTAWVKATPTTASEVGAYSSTAGSALAGRVTTAESTIVQQAGLIASKVSQTDFDAVEGRVGTAESSITQQASQIALKANSTTVNALTGRVSAAETNISANTSAINLRATKTELTTAIDGIQVGGRNLIRNTSNEKTVNRNFNHAISRPLEIGELTYTVWLKANRDTAVNVYINDDTGQNRTSLIFAVGIKITTEYKKYTFTRALTKFTGTGTDGIIMRVYGLAGDVITGKEAKLEKGNKATDWTPAPEDVDAAISTVQANLTVEAGKIASKVSQTDFNALNGRVGTAESTITQHTGEIALRVTTETYNAGIGSKENTITKSNTAPAHLNGRLWLDTSVTPNILKRSTGSEWVKVTPTTPGEVGAYSSGDGSALAGRVSTAETSITANTTAINLRATKSSVDTLTGRVTTSEGAIDVQAGQIALKASQTSVDTLTGRVKTAETNISSNTTAINLRATKSSVDTLTGRVTTAEGSITTQAGQIALKADQTTVDTLTGRVGTAETNISANTTAINLRATKSSVDTLTGRVTTAEGAITTQAGQIALRATTATVNALTGRVSTAETNISANTTAINLRATKTELNTAINGIEVGGRNYFSNKKSIAFNADNEYTLNNYMNVGSFTQFGNLTVPMGTFVGQEMVLSFECISPNGATPLAVYNANGNPRYLMAVKGIQSPIDSVWIKQALKITVTDRGAAYSETVSNKIEFYASGKRGVKIRNVKLEKGNKATDWTPAPEDVDTAISTVQSNLTVEAGKITALTTRVGTAESNITSVTQTVSGINTTISTLRTDVDGKATTVALNAVKSTADGNKTTISNHAGRLTTVETNVSGLQTTVASKADKSQITQLSTSISTKVESSTYNTKMTQLDKAINLRVVQGDVTAAILADKKIKDTRTTNELPSWYFTNYPSQRVEEFKNRSTIGVPGSAIFAKLVTDVPWPNTTGGVVVQTAYSSDGVYNRSGNSAGTAWGGWVKQTDSSNVLSQINLSSEGVLIQGKRIQLDGDVTMTSAFVTKLDTQTLTAITANITSIRSQVLVADSVTSTHVKTEAALVNKIFATDAMVTTLTGKTAFINNIKAISISADKVTTGTLNASNVSVINLNANNIVTGTLDGITVRSSFSYAYDGAILNQGVTTISNGQLTSIGTFTHAYGSTYLWLNPDGLYGENLQANSDVRSLFKLDGKGLTLRAGANMAKYNHTGIEFSRGFMRYYSADDRIEIGSDNGVTLGAFVDGKYLRRITVGGGGANLDPFVDLWATTTMRATLNLNFNRITNANHISGAETILFHNTSNRMVQSSDGQLYLLSAHQINLGWTNGSSVTNILSLTTGQVSMFRNLNMQSNNITNQSDKRLKTNITPTSIVALDAYRRLNMVDYSWIDTNKPSGRHLGVIAQDTPFWSIYDAEADTWMINSSKQIMYNSLGIKELVSIADKNTSDIFRIDTFVGQHEQEIQQLKQKIAELERKIA